jgi:hypothetical protein
MTLLLNFMGSSFALLRDTHTVLFLLREYFYYESRKRAYFRSQSETRRLSQQNPHICAVLLAIASAVLLRWRVLSIGVTHQSVLFRFSCPDHRANTVNEQTSHVGVAQFTNFYR